MRTRSACFFGFTHRHPHWGLSVAAAAACALMGTRARAQMPSDAGFDKESSDTLAADEQLKKEKGDKMPGEKDKTPATAAESTDNLDPKEVDGKAYRFIGLMFRNYIVPKFMFNIFADGGATVNVFTFGPELTIRKDGIEFEVGWAVYGDYSMNPFLFKGKSDDTQAYELVSSTMKLGTIYLEIMKDVPIDSKGHFSFLIGGGVGLSVVAGNLYRSQVYPKAGQDPNNPNVTDPDAWELCPGPQPAPFYQNASHPYCDASNSHFGDPRNHTGYSEPSWFNGGSKPSVFPYISLPQLSFRYKPIKQLQTRLDAGFSITGFYLGMNAAYGL